MIDWITAVLPCKHDPSKLVSGMVMSFDSQGNNEWVVNKQVTVEGSYSSKIQVKSHTDSTIWISGNPTKFLQGHNIFGTDDLTYLMGRFFDSLLSHDQLGLHPTYEQYEAIQDGDYFLKRVDINQSWHLKNRDDVIKTLEGAGFEIARTTKKSISIKDPDGGQNIRLKGAIYEQDFRFGKELRADIEQASERYRASRGDRVQEARATLDRLVERKRESNEQRYPRAEQTPIADYVKNLEHRSHSHRDSTFTDVGHPSLSEQENRTERRDYGSTEDSHSRFSGQGGQREITGLYRRQEPQAIMRFSEQGRRELGQGQSYGSDGVLTDDRIRKALTRSLGTSTGTATAEGSRFTQDVREYQAGQFQREKSLQRFLRQYERSRPDQKHQLEQLSTASEQLERSTRELSGAKYELEQAITSVRNASQQVKEINEPARSYGLRM